MDLFAECALSQSGQFAGAAQDSAELFFCAGNVLGHGSLQPVIYARPYKMSIYANACILMVMRESV